ncbi:hypothetical protein LEP1GSC192_2689 [Leptospira sp. B5-022]|nr:hypothetical protein LEP1GSC192_2689 [Leptospira sp. B5-022]
MDSEFFRTFGLDFLEGWAGQKGWTDWKNRVLLKKWDRFLAGFPIFDLIFF